MAQESDRESNSIRRAGGQAPDRLDALLQKLEGELEFLRRDRDELREQLRRRDQQVEQLQAMIATREQLWQQQREELSGQIAGLEAKVTDLGLQLKVAQGTLPSSEKGAAIARAFGSPGGGGGGGGDDTGGGQPSPAPAGTPSNQKRRYLLIFERPGTQHPARDYASKQLYWEAVGSDRGLIPPPATIFGSQLFAEVEEAKHSRFTIAERQSLFGRERGLHSKNDKTTVYDLRLTLAEISCTQENLRDLAGTQYFRKSNALGPAGCRMTWETLATVASLVAEYAFPMERLAAMVGHPYFSSANVSRWLISTATALVDVYIALGKRLATCPYLRMDDTSALVLAMREEARAGLIPDKAMSGEQWDAYLAKLRKNKRRAALLVPVIEAFGRVAQRADAKGAKVTVNVTLISGQLDPDDYRSRVYFYRTHFGQAGNLLSRILEYRKAGAPTEVTVQSDCSSQNHVEPEIAAHVKVIYVGCSSHARRDIFRYRERDQELCYYLLRRFAALAHIEEAIKRGPMTEERILRYRQRYAAKVWTLIHGVCQAVVDETAHLVTGPSRWKKGDKLYDACLYIIRHFEALTRYLTDAHLEPDNNAIEQGLRGEKLIENASLFRKSELGRIGLDIHRTFIASCNACGLAYHDFLREVSTADPEDLAVHPERYFPHQIAKARAIRDPPTGAPAP